MLLFMFLSGFRFQQQQHFSHIKATFDVKSVSVLCTRMALAIQSDVKYQAKKGLKKNP